MLERFISEGLSMEGYWTLNWKEKTWVDEQNSEHRRLSLVDPAGHLLQTFLQLHYCSSSSVFCLQSSKLYIPFLKTLRSEVVQRGNIITHFQCMHAVSYCQSSRSLSICVRECICMHTVCLPEGSQWIQTWVWAPHKASVRWRIHAGFTVYSSSKETHHYNAHNQIM